MKDQDDGGKKTCFEFSIKVSNMPQLPTFNSQLTVLALLNVQATID